MRSCTHLRLAKACTLCCLVGLALSLESVVPAASSNFVRTDNLELGFAKTVFPFVKTYCVNCHSGEKPKAQFDLGRFKTMESAVRDFEHWELVLERLEAGEMPPEKEKVQPTAEARKEVIAWIEGMRRQEARKNSGDPGPVLARRLSNAEYDYTIRDLTGVDVRPTREFPVDPANQAGFDNSGESLAMSPALLKKYLQAARQVADHLVLKPEGFDFASHPVLAETDRDKYSILRIVDFYQRQPTDYADYFLAAWRYQNRAALGKRRSSLVDVARESNVSSKYLAIVWAALTDAKEKVGPIAKLQVMWSALPKPDAKQPDIARVGCEKMRDYVVQLRAKLEWDFQNLELKGFSPGGQAFAGWKNRQFAAHRRTLNPDALQIEGKTKYATVGKKVTSVNGTPDAVRKGETNQVIVPPDPELTIPEDQIAWAQHVAAFKRFCKIFPDTFYRSERGRMHFDKIKEKQDKGRFLSAGFHNMMGYFRDDQPLYELILDDAGQRELDRLWLEFDFIAFVPERQHAEFIFYERAESKTIKGPEFDFARSEDKNVTSEPMIQRLADVYLAKARASLRTNGGDLMVIGVIEDHFKITSANIRRIEQIRPAAEPSHLRALLRFADRAYRRPLSEVEQGDLLAFYRGLREKEGLSHEDAIRDAVVSVLMSPHFCYRIDLVESGGTKGRSRAWPVAKSRTQRAEKALGAPAFAGAMPLSDYALASRLSYFLWSSMPDEELLACAAKGDLQRPVVLVAQARRMLKDSRARGLAVEFGGNWLDFRRFEGHNAVDRDRFPMFDNQLREAMFEEPVQFFLDVIHSNRSVLDFVYARDTFVNAVLAKHYGIAGIEHATNRWAHVTNAGEYGRGGLLPMSVFLTQNAPGLRTSPVKRGYWVVRRVLGERIPPPPAVVPELPHDEAKLDLPLREVLAKHREDSSCAACHSRFDSFGLVFEGYGPVGERREKDLGGRPVDTHTQFPGGSEGSGLEGLRRHVREHREEDFLESLCRKLLAYALNRTLILSDDATIDAMRAKLKTDQYRFARLVESIVTSPQFRTKRGPDNLAMKGN